MQIRLGFDPRSRPRLIDGPEITAQGFTAQKLQQSGERMETIGGRTYTVVAFKTAIAAARAGKFEIGPVKARAQISVPRQSSSQSRQRSPFDLFNPDDPFSSPFFDNPFDQLSERHEVDVKSEATTFEVKPLPPNAPPQFSGAVGNFAMTTDAKPTNLQVGDPITVTSTVTGRGNFDRVNAPVLENERGWHKYPPSSKFTQDDDVGISGTKTFETVISPNEKKQVVPPLVFAYFDPAKESYVTLRSDAVPIVVEGGAASVPNAAVASPSGASSPAKASTPSIQSEAKPADILYQLTERPKSPQSFTSLFRRPIFWEFQLVPLIGLLAFVGWKVRQSRSGNREAQRLAALQHEAAELSRKLRQTRVSPQEYYAEASRMVRIKTALASGGKRINPNSVDVETAANAFQLDPESKETLMRLFERSDELRYSGAHNGAETISPEARREVLDFRRKLTSMRSPRLLATLCCAAVCIAGRSALAQADAQFAKANQDFAENRFKEAIKGYDELIRAGEWSAAVFYDLGNAYFRTGDFGRAILNYQRALALDRQHPESAANLRIVRDEARALSMQPNWLDRHLQMASTNQYSIAAAVSFWVAIFCVAGFIFPSGRRSARAIAMLMLAFTICAISVYAIYRTDSNENNMAIVTGTNVTARLATADNAGSVLALPPGSEVTFLSRRGDRTYVESPNDQRGWIRKRR